MSSIRKHRPGARRLLTCFLTLASLSSLASAAPDVDVQLVIRNQSFVPRTLTIPAGRNVKITINNEDALPAEFESSQLNREKVIPGNSQLPVYIGPLSPGTYGFFNDFHPASTGVLIVKPAKQ